MSKTPEQVALLIHNSTKSKKQKPVNYKKTEIQANLNDNTPEKPLSLISYIHKDLLSWREKPVSQTYMDKICEDLDRWLKEKPECFMLEEFLEWQEMTYDFYDMIRERSPRLQSMHDFAMMCLGNRRERGGMTGTFNAGLVDRSQHMYSRTWERGLEKREEMKAKAQAAAEANVKFKTVTQEQEIVVPKWKLTEKKEVE